MRPSSKELADRIDVMVAFQNKEVIQFRNRKHPERDWSTSVDSLGFNWDKFEYRLKPTIVVPREGYVFNNQLHRHPSSHKHRVGEDTCFRVREVLDTDSDE